MREIQLTQGMVALVDDEDYEYLNQWKWSARKGNYTYYAVRQLLLKETKTYKWVYMHRLVVGITNPKLFVDHKNHYGLDNQRHNLRIANRSQNMANRKSNKNSSSRFVGVSFYRPSKKWVAQAQKDYHHYHVGYFETEVEAALAYNKIAIELHGEFANLNTI